MKIIKSVFGGYGLGILKNKTCFIEKALAEDEIIPYIYKKRKGVLYGRIDSIIQGSPKRIKPSCPYFSICAGCSYQMLSYEDELELKASIFEESMRKISGIDCSITEFYKAEDRYHYRNKIETSIKKDRDNNLFIGFHRRDDWRKVLDIEECIIANKPLMDLYKGLRLHLDANKDIISDELTHFTMRSNRRGELLLVFWFENLECSEKFINMINKFKHRDLAGIKIYNSIIETKKQTALCQVASMGREIIEDEYYNYRFAFSSESFFQINPEITEKIIKKLIDKIKASRPVLVFDLYAGNGFWGIVASAYAQRIIGIEISEISEREFNYNKEINNITNYEYIRGDVKHFLINSDLMPDMIILDPPRSGVSPKVIRRIRNKHAKEIIYISCNPTTLARDMQEICQDYEISEIILFDMFPNTFHIECMVHFVLKE